MQLDDKDIRTLLLKRLNSYKNCHVYEEMTVPSGKARADLVAVNGHITAYEIKSDYDSLNRLTSQIEEYESNFEKNFIVVGEKYSKKVQDIVPNHWGVVIVSGKTHEKLKIRFMRQAKLNPNISFSNVLNLLTATQVKYLARESNILSNKFSNSEIQKMFKQDIISHLNISSTKTKKNYLTKIVKETLKGKNIFDII